ncbi:class I SAM-dependent methyltransferase [Legionella impletisoli]|uniref:SAM-dependent methyltransferase n=1 Tax=Legionella impletisoli TaxID=343510 RepID=A0A917JVE4_9GAMM|nr:SAM-dependent methyltransferase [Legionella impletisoli]GGI86915.1 SAM-dependent methyltransferase [Legionella impletisoli]
MSLIERISNQIREKGDISFAEYMHLALYHPKFGYYSAGLPKFGRGGDFVTAPELTPFFGYALANQCEPILRELESPSILEFGAGSGRLCVDILTRLNALVCLPEVYYILEVSPNLRYRQEVLIQEQLPDLASRVQWLSKWPEKPFNGILIANEVLDAMPVNRFVVEKSQLLESHISLDSEGKLKEIYKPSENERLIHHIETRLPSVSNPYQSEVNLFINGWINAASTILLHGVVLILDYGFPRQEYYHPDRQMGTLMCHYQHQSHTNPLAHPGEEDITAHVDFTHVAEAAVDAGFQILGYTNQAAFLLANRILDFLTDVASETERVKHTQAVKLLLQESEMGELFKVMALGKRFDEPLSGFQLFDKRSSL